MLTDRVALVTGAGTGIGKTTAVLLARFGATVALCDRVGDALHATETDVAALGRPFLAQHLDVRDRAAAETFVAEIGARTISAGVITFGVEYRDVDPESLTATYAANPDHLAELDARSPDGGFSDEGVSIHVCGTDDGHEYLRFDIFDDEPHYHYVHKTAPGADIVNNVVAFDDVALGDMLPSAIERLRSRLAAMLTSAGGDHLVDQLDPALVHHAVEEVDAMARRARDAYRAASST